MTCFTGGVRAVVLSDTHLRDGGTKRLPHAVYAALRDADVVLHCGDVVERGLLDELATFAPVHAVRNLMGRTGAAMMKDSIQLRGADQP